MFLFIQHLNILLLSLSSPHLSLNCHHTRALTDSEIREEERSEEQAKRMMRTTRRALSMTGVTLMLMMVVMMTMSGVDGVSHMDMSLGGVHYFSSLADPAASSQTRHIGRTGAYCHANAMQAVFSDNTIKNISAIFNTTIKPCHAEVGYSAGPGWWTGWYTVVYKNNGFFCNRSSVNLPANKPSGSWNLTAWKAFVDNAKNLGGHKIVSPVFSPNSASDPLNVPFATDPYYEFIRQTALYGGGLTIDSPPSYAFARGTAYVKFIIQEIQWAKTNNLYATYIISPNSAQENFLPSSQLMLQTLVNASALPNEFAFENYDLNPPNNYLNSVGTETQPYTVANVSLNFARSAPSLPFRSIAH